MARDISWIQNKKHEGNESLLKDLGKFAGIVEHEKI